MAAAAAYPAAAATTEEEQHPAEHQHPGHFKGNILARPDAVHEQQNPTAATAVAEDKPAAASDRGACSGSTSVRQRASKRLVFQQVQLASAPCQQKGSRDHAPVAAAGPVVMGPVLQQPGCSTLAAVAAHRDFAPVGTGLVTTDRVSRADQRTAQQGTAPSASAPLQAPRAHPLQHELSSGLPGTAETVRDCSATAAALSTDARALHVQDGPQQALGVDHPLRSTPVVAASIAVPIDGHAEAAYDQDHSVQVPSDHQQRAAQANSEALFGSVQSQEAVGNSQSGSGSQEQWEAAITKLHTLVAKCSQDQASQGSPLDVHATQLQTSQPQAHQQQVSEEHGANHQVLPQHDAPEPASAEQAHLQMLQHAGVHHTPVPAMVTSAVQDKCRPSAAAATLEEAVLPSKPPALGATSSTSAQAQGVAAVAAAPASGSAAAQQTLPSGLAAPVAVMAAVHDPCATSPAAAVSRSAATAAAGVFLADVPAAAASVICSDGKQTTEPAQPTVASVAVQPAQVQQHIAASEAGRAYVERPGSARSRLARVSAVWQQQENRHHPPEDQQHAQQHVSLHQQQHTVPWQAKKRQRSEDLHLEDGGQDREFEEPHGKRQRSQCNQAAGDVGDKQQSTFQSGCSDSTYCTRKYFC